MVTFFGKKLLRIAPINPSTPMTMRNHAAAMRHSGGGSCSASVGSLPAQELLDFPHVALPVPTQLRVIGSDDFQMLLLLPPAVHARRIPAVIAHRVIHDDRPHALDRPGGELVSREET